MNSPDHSHIVLYEEIPPLSTTCTNNTATTTATAAIARDNFVEYEEIPPIRKCHNTNITNTTTAMLSTARRAMTNIVQYEEIPPMNSPASQATSMQLTPNSSYGAQCMLVMAMYQNPALKPPLLT